MKRKQLISLILSGTLALGMAVPAMAAETPALHDVPEDHWARAIIEEWYGFGVIGGDTDTGAFRPDDYLSRAEFATLLDRIMGYPLLEIKHFNDVPADAWYAETMSRLNSAGVIQGDGNNMVRPKDSVTRQEAAVILCRALGIPEQEADVDFLDKEEIAGWAQGAVGALYNMGAVQGYEGYFEPQAPIARCQAVTLLNNLIGAVMTRPGAWSQDVSGDMFVNTKRARLEDMTVTGDLIISHGVDSGEVILSGVRVRGDLIIRGGGEKSVQVLAGCQFDGDVIIEKTVEGSLRLLNEGDAPLSRVFVNSGRPSVILEGDMTAVEIHSDCQTVLRSGSVETLSAFAAESVLTIEKESSVSQLNIEKEAKDTELFVEGSITALTAYTAAKVNNTGKMAAAHAAASGLVLAGKKPDKITMSSGVSRPKDGEGKSISGVSIVSGPSKK